VDTLGQCGSRRRCRRGTPAYQPASRRDRVDLLHRNIAKYGTIYNTIAATCDVAGEVVVEPTVALVASVAR
jgi:hypothetical protein